MVRIGHFVAITVLLLSSVLAFGQIQQDVNGLEVRKPDDKNDILFEEAGHEDVVDDLERRSPFIQALLGILRGVKGIKALVDRNKKKKHKKAVKASERANHANNQQTHHRRMLEEDDELVGTESERKFFDEQDIDAFIERYLDNEMRKFVVAILKNLTEEEGEILMFDLVHHPSFNF